MAGIWPKFIHKAIDNLYYFDWFYIKVLIQKAFLPFSSLVAKFDDKVIDGFLVDGWKSVNKAFYKLVGNIIDDVFVDQIMVDGFGGRVPAALGGGLRAMQNGKIQRYIMVAVAALICLMLFKGAL